MSACRTCDSLRSKVTMVKDEIRRLARLMARSERNERRLFPDLTAAKVHLAAQIEGQSAHDAECEAAA